MITKLLRSILMLSLGLCLTAATVWAQTGTIEGHITDQQTGQALLSANVFISSASRGAATNAEGDFTIEDIPYGTYLLRVSYIGYATKTVTVTVDEATEEVNIELMQAVGTLDELVVTALGGTAQVRSVSFASQSVDQEDLTITQNTNVKTALAGKIAGVQVLAQAGSKLGDYGDIRIRGAISLTSAVSEPLYVVDGVPVTEPDMIDMSNVAKVTVLKGPNATALYGQRGENGVVMITTQKPTQGGVSVEFNSSITFQEVTNLPNFQNQYGQGYSGEEEWRTFSYDPELHPAYFEPMDGMRYINSSFADASWGPKLDGEPYAAWFVWWPDSPYYGQGVPYKAHPNTVADFYDTGFKTKNGIALNIFDERYQGRASYTNLQQGGLLPFSDLKKHYMAASFSFDVNEAFNISADINYTLQEINGQVYSDGYGNQTSGTFNNWYGRNLDTKYMRELGYLRTPEGFYASWNWWNPETYADAYQGNRSVDYMKPTFWFNPYTWMNQYDQLRDEDNLLVDFEANYELSDNFELTGAASQYVANNSYEYYLPYSIERSSGHSLYIDLVNGFGVNRSKYVEENYSGRLDYIGDYGDWSFDAFAGGNIRNLHGSAFDAEMNLGNVESGGLIIPDVFKFSNSREEIVPSKTTYQKRVYSLYGSAKLGYQDFLYLNATYRQDWSSALPEDNNGYGYPSVGVSFVFSEFISADFLSYGQIRAGWAQVGDDVGAEALVGSYDLSDNPYTNPANGVSIPLLYVDNQRIDPNIKPALNSSYEAGTNMRFFNSRFGIDATYYYEQRKNEIVYLDLSSATGFSSYLTNAGTSERRGIELALDGFVIRNNSFQWNLLLNLAANKTVVTALPGGKDTYDLAGSSFGFVTITHNVDEEWGQIRGAGIKRTEDGTPVLNDDGLYEFTPNKYYGSVLPDYTGGLVSSMSYNNFNLAFSIDFQKGGKFFSLTEHWATNTGLMATTAGPNDLGNPKRDPVVLDGSGNVLSESGGVHVTGVDGDGNPVDTYIPAVTYYGQFFSNRIAEPFVHDASYIKLRAVKLSYTLPADLFDGVVRSATVGVVARNLWLIYTNNPNDWDPSQFAETYGENGQLPGTRSFGVNVNITF